MADNTYLALTTFGDGLADGESHSGSLNEFIEFHESFKYGLLLVEWDAFSGVFHGRSPVHLAIFTADGRYGNGWVRIDNHNLTLNLPRQNSFTKAFTLTQPENAKNSQYFRIEIFATIDEDADCMQLGEFQFTYPE